MILNQILTALHSWAPPGIAQAYDNVGLQVGEPDQDISLGLIALEITPEVIREAENSGVQLIVTHHPLLFHPLRTLTPKTLSGSMALRLARSGIAVIAAHTNLDAVKDGVSSALANSIGLSDLSILSPASAGMLKLVTFVPDDYLEPVRQALSKAVAGRIGDYSDVAFLAQGVGIFRPLSSANPFIGTAGGGLENVSEWRLEVAITRDRLRASVAALLEAHPYQTPVYDVYEMVQTASGFGLGVIGTLREPLSLAEFLQHVCRKLETKAARYVGDPASQVRRVAVCGGAGRDLIPEAIRKGADVYVTADITYHSFFDVMDAEGGFTMALVDAGHYETEAATERLLLSWLSEHVPSVRWVRTSSRTSPVRTFISP